MIDIDLVKLKELALAATPGKLENLGGIIGIMIEGRKEWTLFCTADDTIDSNSPFIEAFSPSLAIQLIEQLEAAQRERDEAVLLRLEVSVALSSATVRYEQAEAELKRRDAQEPVAWAHRLINKSNGVAHPWVYGSAEKEPSEGDIFRIEVAPLYTHPVPEVLPELSEE